MMRYMFGNNPARYIGRTSSSLRIWRPWDLIGLYSIVAYVVPSGLYGCIAVSAGLRPILVDNVPSGLKK